MKTSNDRSAAWRQHSLRVLTAFLIAWFGAAAGALGTSTSSDPSTDAARASQPTGETTEGDPGDNDHARILVTVAQTERSRLERPGTTAKGYNQRYRTAPRTHRISRALVRQYGLTRLDAWPIPAIEVDCIVFSLKASEQEETLAQLAQDPRVESVQPLYEFETLVAGPDEDDARGATLPKAAKKNGTFDDPYRSMQHAFATMEIGKVHGLTQGSGVRVAVVDTGIDVSHPDLLGRVIKPRDFVDQQRQLAPDRHGTAVAGVIASIADNGIGIVGVAPEVELMALKACRPVGEGADRARCDSFTLALAIDFALQENVDVLNLSLAGPEDPILTRLLEVAIKRGVIVVAASPAIQARNRFPASHPSILAVGAWVRGMTSEEIMPHSLLAPGVDVLTTVPGGEYDFMSGSSLAAAQVTGVVALLLQLDRSLSAAKLRSLLSGGLEDALPLSACEAVASLLGSPSCNSQRL